MTILLDRIARTASRSWRRSLAIAALVLVVLGVLVGTVGGQFTDEFSVPGTESQQALDQAAHSAERDGFQVAMPGPVAEAAEQQLAPVGELIRIAVAVIALTLVFGSVSAMLLTLISALIALAGGMMLLTLGAGLTSVPEISPTLAVMLGLGAGIDYALLIVGRYREHLAAGESVPDAAAAAGRTAGVSVLAAGAIVAVAISGLLATGIPFVGRMGLASAVVVAGVAVGAVTLLPALMGAFAKRLRPRRAAGLSPWWAFARWDRRGTRRPWIALVAGIAALAVLAAPFTDLRLG